MTGRGLCKKNESKQFTLFSILTTAFIVIIKKKVRKNTVNSV